MITNTYSIHRISGDLWVINELDKTQIFIIKGKERTLIIDTGTGMVDLQEVLGKLDASMNVVVVNTHAHPDHNGGNNQFDTVFVGRYDEPESHFTGDGETFEDLAAYMWPKQRNLKWNPGPAKHICTLHEGDKLDIGDYCLKVIEAPSHTIGSIVLIEEKMGWTFTGDILLQWPAWGWLYNSASLKDYYETVSKLYDRRESLGELFPSHTSAGKIRKNVEDWKLPQNILEIYQNGIWKILNGNYKSEEFCYNRILQGHSYKNKIMKSVTFSTGGIVFDPDRIGI